MSQPDDDNALPPPDEKSADAGPSHEPPPPQAVEDQKRGAPTDDERLRADPPSDPQAALPGRDEPPPIAEQKAQPSTRSPRRALSSKFAQADLTAAVKRSSKGFSLKFGRDKSDYSSTEAKAEAGGVGDALRRDPTGIITCAASALALMLVLLRETAVVAIPPVPSLPPAVTASLTVQDMLVDGNMKAPNWNELFGAYDLEFAFKNTSIRACHHLPQSADTEKMANDETIPAGTRLTLFLDRAVDPEIKLEPSTLCGATPPPP